MALEVSPLTTTRPGATTARAAEDSEETSKPAPAAREEDELQEENSPASDVDPARLAEVVERANRAAEAQATSDRSVRFEVYEPTGDVVVKVLDKGSEQVVAQLPSRQFLSMATRLQEDLGGVTLDAIA